MNTQLPFEPASFPVPPGAAAFAQPDRGRQVLDSADFRQLLGRFEAIGLAQMDAVALLDRTDTKYVLHTSQLYTALAALSTDYQVLEIDSVRLHPYRTLYFDTADLAANGFVTALLFVLEKEWGFHFEASKKVTYERIELITPANSEALLADLRQRTGLPVKRVAVGRIDFSRDTAEVLVYYDEP